MYMIPIIFFLVFIFFFLTLIIAISIRQYHQSIKVLDYLKTESLKKIEISYLQVSMENRGSINGGMQINAIMYLSDNFIFIIPKRKYFSVFFYLTLPLLIVKEYGQFNKISGFNNLVKPEKISLTSWNSISITLHINMLFYRKYNIQIRALNKSDIENFCLINNWN